MKLEISNRKKFGKFINILKLNKTILNNQQVRGNIQNKIFKKYFEKNENEDTCTKTYGMKPDWHLKKFIAVKGYVKKRRNI